MDQLYFGGLGRESLCIVDKSELPLKGINLKIEGTPLVALGSGIPLQCRGHGFDSWSRN